jgi:hypothetical protein
MYCFDVKYLNKIIIFIFVLAGLYSCGNDYVHDPSYIAEDERNVTVESSTDKAEDLLEQNLNLEDLNNQDNIISIAGSCEGTSLLKDIITYGDMIKNLGGSIEAPLDFDEDFVGLQKFLTASGVKHFNAIEVGTPGSMSKAKSCGLKHLIPNRACWLRVAALLLTGDKIRTHLDSKVALTSLYRSGCYNEKVKGTKNSDHLTARSMDVSFYEKEKRQKAADFICQNFWKDDLYNLSSEMNTASRDETLNISIGLGGTYMHIGLSSPHGRRYWVYNSYVLVGGQANSCWSRP